MAILKGFPPSNTISPSVRIIEKDLSFVPPDQSFHRAAVIGFASKGPINIPTMIRNRTELHRSFGFPHPKDGDPYLIYAAMQYLMVANQLYVVRVADTNNASHERAATAQIAVADTGGSISGVSLTNSEDGPGTLTTNTYRFAKDSFFRWRLNGVLASKVLVVLDGNYLTSELVADLNSQLTTFDGIEFYLASAGAADGDDSSGATGDDFLGVKASWAYGPSSSLELVSVQDAMYGGPASASAVTAASTAELQGTGQSGCNVSGLATSSTQAKVTGVNAFNSSLWSAGETDDSGAGQTSATANAAAAARTISVVVDGSDNVLVDQVQQDIVLPVGSDTTLTEVIDVINAQIAAGTIPGGFVASDENGDHTSGVGAAGELMFSTLHRGRDAKILVKPGGFTSPGFPNTTKSGASVSIVSGAGAEETAGILTGGVSTGTTSVTFTADSAGIEGNTTQVIVKNDVREGTFQIDVYTNLGDDQLESWGNLTKDSTSRFYVETYLVLVSDYIRAIDTISNTAPPADGTYSLVGGADGIPADPDDQDTMLAGNPVAFSGLYTISEPEQIDLDLLCCPGKASTTIIQAMLEICQNYRHDCMAIIDPPFGLTVGEITDWQNGSHPLNGTRFDSDFGALYWPWLRMRDTHNKVDVWVPPSGSVMAVYARSDQLSAPWFAPAGVVRGRVPNISDVFSRPTLGERDLMYGNRNCINPIVQFSDTSDFLVWGQKTMQRRPTALDRVNVRRMMFVIEKRIRAASRGLLFEPHDETFRRAFKNIATDILRDVQVGRGLTDFIVQADTDLNTPDVIDRNEFRARIGVQPTRAAEFIFIEFSLHRTGSFTENTDVF
jgi:phage tail sheath protein FI